MALKHQKNYQIWHHRQLIMERIGDPTGETEFTEKMFEKDSKNYHVWSYRLVPVFGMSGRDLIKTDVMLDNGLSVGLTCGIRVRSSISTSCSNRM